jgi:hypothetical protein
LFPDAVQGVTSTVCCGLSLFWTRDILSRLSPVPTRNQIRTVHYVRFAQLTNKSNSLIVGRSVDFDKAAGCSQKGVSTPPATCPLPPGRTGKRL